MRKCEINAMGPITCFTVPIIGHTTLNLTDEEIYKCLCAKAEVVEILPNGKTRTLNFSNYNKPVVEEKPVEQKVQPEVKKENLSETTIPEDRTGFREIKAPKIEVSEEVGVANTDPSPVKTHEVSSRNNNHQNNNKSRKNKNNNKR